ncbi:peroxiredoxin-like family protein [Flavobacterium algicola]|uniref:peroxiredoxin-like family protein n=1 Tax=Flavobacterium algicola TaxID=556529 RepID=UPI001EFE4F9E|nr:peroxiredoxin-like family protein [Flavobacterium algicola]MCG9793380.1 AhpC/TSA family protein [Flavobacterium algicola]
MMRPTPKHKAPELNFPLLDGSQWNLFEHKPENFTLIVFYRGIHCPVCKKYLQELQNLLPDFEKKGVNVIAVSMDNEQRARLARKDWEIKDLKLGYNLDAETAKDWGLYMSKGIKDGEPDVFSEPGLFLIDNKSEVYYSAINSNPWGRPYLPSFLDAIDFILEKKYPARGELV